MVFENCCILVLWTNVALSIGRVNLHDALRYQKLPLMISGSDPVLRARCPKSIVKQTEGYIPSVELSIYVGLKLDHARLGASRDSSQMIPIPWTICDILVFCCAQGFFRPNLHPIPWTYCDILVFGCGRGSLGLYVIYWYFGMLRDLLGWIFPQSED